MFEILDVIIGLFFVYLLLSLVCTAVNEYIASILNKRGKELIKGIDKLLDDANLRDEFYAHPLIETIFPDRADFVDREAKVKDKPWLLRGVYRLATYAASAKNRNLRAPSYLPARSFALALLDVVGQGAAAAPQAPAQPGAGGAAANAQGGAGGAPTPAAPDEMDALIAQAAAKYPEIGKLLRSLRREPAADVMEYSNLRLTAEMLAARIPLDVKERALTGLLGVRTGVQKLEDGVEVWFNGAMDRVSGAYKRYTQTVLFFIALVVAIVANADTLQIWRTLSANDELRDGIVKQAIDYFPAASDTADSVALPIPGTTTGPPSQEHAKAVYDSAMATLEATNLELGWSWEDAGRLGIARKGAADGRWSWAPAADWQESAMWRKFFGLLITAFALSLGAPFWFDTLNKFINIRAAGRAPQENPVRPESAGKRAAETAPK